LFSGNYYSRGKFLLTAEYLVLFGAKALAVPLKLGQRMIVGEHFEPGILKWETFVRNELWFSAIFSLPDLQIQHSSDLKTAQFVMKLLQAADKVKGSHTGSGKGISIWNQIEFDIKWGLGSSSSLVSNVAWSYGIDPYLLFRELYQGSGYDIFCTRAEQAILFSLKEQSPEVQEVLFKPDYSPGIFFIYLGRKQDSQESVRQFIKSQKPEDHLVSQVSEITESMLNAKTLDDFIFLLREHEDLMASVLGKIRIKEERFAGFPGEIKSLGAWGGDFVMAASHRDFNEVKDYFSRKNLEVIFRWEEIVK